MGNVVIGVDVGSSAVKAVAFDRGGRPVDRAGRPVETLRPGPGRAECDPGHLIRRVEGALSELLSRVHQGGNTVRAIGLACQRSSFLAWERDSGMPFTPVISWQDLRAEPICREMAQHRAGVHEKTGLPLTAHYGGPKFLWLRRHDPEFFRWVGRPGAVFSPLSSFLLSHLTGETVPVVDESIAGRTLLVDIRKRTWDRELVEMFEVPEGLLPEIVPVCGGFGRHRFENRDIPVTCSIGDQQAALAGLGSMSKGCCAISLGTSGGVLATIGSSPIPVPGLLTAVALSTAETIVYAAEGTVNAVGSLFRWFEEEQGISGAETRWDRTAAPSSQGWVMIPGMFGIAAPYWKESAPTLFSGGRGEPAPEVRLRAGIEAVALLVGDILGSLETVQGADIDRIVAAGGSAKGPLLQCLADVLGRVVFRSPIEDASALGCAFLAGREVGFWKSDPVSDAAGNEEPYRPRISDSDRQVLVENWHRLLREQGIYPPRESAAR
jgi:glycerol kinase